MPKALILFLCGLIFLFHCSAYELKSSSQGRPASTKTNLNIVFCPLHYPDQRLFLNDTATLTKRLSRVKPFDEFTAYIRFYRVALSAKEEAALFRATTQYPYLEARRDFLDGLRARLKSDYKLVILDASGGILAAELSAPEKFSLIILGRNKYKTPAGLANGFMHELGHALGLRDEWFSGEAAFCPPGPPNCAIDRAQAKQWWGDLVVPGGRAGYICGCCGNKNYIRPTVASLMNKPERAEDFGPVNERYLRNALAALAKTP